MRTKKGKMGFMAIKVDLEKAYDCISCAFLFDTLVDVGLPPSLVKAIMGCVAASLLQIQWNGGLTESFQPARGLIQGCPLSPYLFVLCIERLAHGITTTVNNGDWKPIRLCNDGLLLTHLFFADDLLLFGEAAFSQVATFHRIIKAFCDSSRQHVSLAKTTNFFSKNVHVPDQRALRAVLGIRKVSDLCVIWEFRFFILG